MAKEDTKPQIYPKHTLEYTGVEKQITEEVISFFFLIQNS